MKQANNQQLCLAKDFVQYTNKHLFLTGKAGTGKTTFLRDITSNIHKRSIVVAPTGVAAINAGGVTIHSFFQIGFGPQIPYHYITKKEKASPQRALFRFSKDKINIIKSLDLLIIDEISMVRPDLLDAIDKVLRRFRDRHLPFGGLQLLMIGDLQQLPPIVKDEEKALLDEYYNSPFFFSSIALSKCEYLTIELQHVYRQSDSRFVQLLNQLRTGHPSAEVLAQINSRYQANFHPSGAQNYIRLTTHNHQAEQVNINHLQDIPLPSQIFHAKIVGNFPEQGHPTSLSLHLKVGAQVMFVKNDSSPHKRYYNGKIGKIVHLDRKQVIVQCPGEEHTIEVTTEEWHNTKYTLDEKSKEIKEEVVGKFIQHPLKLAWAITIHKSQGLTFDNVIIDAGAAFSHGQVYVALSRCKSLEGIVLSSPISQEAIITNQIVNNFTSKYQEQEPNIALLQSEKLQYQQTLLKELIDFNKLLKLCYYASQLLHQYSGSFHGNIHQMLETIIPKLRNDLQIVGDKFKKQLEKHFLHTRDLENDKYVQDRIQQAIPYFIQVFKDTLEAFLNEYTFDADNKEAKKRIETTLEQIQIMYHQHLSCLKACSTGFLVEDYLKAKALASIETSKTRQKKKKQTAKNTKLNPATEKKPGVIHEELYERLRAWRNQRASEKNIPVYMIAQQKTLSELSTALPLDWDELKHISGMGTKRMAAYGKEILTIIEEYCTENDIIPPSIF